MMEYTATLATVRPNPATTTMSSTKRLRSDNALGELECECSESPASSCALLISCALSFDITYNYFSICLLLSVATRVVTYLRTAQLPVTWLAQYVTHAADCVNQRGVTHVNLATQVGNVGLHNVAVAAEIVVPNVV